MFFCKSRVPARVTPLSVPPEVVAVIVVPEATVPPLRVPPAMVKELLTLKVLPTVREPPESVRASWLVTEFTKSAADVA